VSSSSEDLLARLVTEARQDMQRRRALITQDDLERAIHSYTPKDFAGALRRPGLAVIAEMKQRTPSMGVLADDYQPTQLAHAYTQGGAAAISVLTHMASFGGRPEHIEAARFATDLPILRKDFVTDPYEVGEARAAGADAVLLIVAALDPRRLAELLHVTLSRGIAALVEVHDENEVDVAVNAGARVIGVNNRDLRTFKVDLGLTERLRRVVPRDIVLVSESGIRTVEHARRMREAGADAILVGESLMRSEDPAARIRELASA
jgi:indole-3-glycerol phosphate synthase